MAMLTEGPQFVAMEQVSAEAIAEESGTVPALKKAPAAPRIVSQQAVVVSPKFCPAYEHIPVGGRKSMGESRARQASFQDEAVAPPPASMILKTVWVEWPHAPVAQVWGLAMAEAAVPKTAALIPSLQNESRPVTTNPARSKSFVPLKSMGVSRA